MATTPASAARVPEVFVDGASAVFFQAGAVRLDLVALETAGRRGLRDDQEAAVLVRLVLPPDGFIQVLESIGDFLRENGIEAPDDPGPAGASPNFDLG